MIAEIEALLQGEVCQRLSRGVHLAERELEDLRAGRIGVVAVGAVTAPAVDIAAQALNDIRARAPGVELNIEIDNSTALTRELLASRLDFIMARAPDEFDPGLFESLTIGVEEALLVVRRSHPLLGRGPVGLAAISEFEWVMQPRGALIRRAIEDLFLAAGVEPPRCLVTTTSITLSLMMAARSDAIAPIALGAAKFATERSNADGLAILPTDFSIVVKPYSLITLRDRPLSPAASAVYDVIRERALPRE